MPALIVTTDKIVVSGMENEIRKHIGKIVAELSNRKKSIGKRIGEIVIEMAIIVFAVSLAVYLEQRREHNREQAEVKEFLLGLRDDLQNDIAEVKSDIEGYKTQNKWFTYFVNQDPINKDSAKVWQWVIWNTTQLLINSGRYEGFKASGKMNTIEDESLRTKILDLYQEVLVALISTTSSYIERKHSFQQMLFQQWKFRELPGDNLVTVLKQDELRNYCIQLCMTEEVVFRYERSIACMKDIVAQIDKLYGVEEQLPAKEN